LTNGDSRREREDAKKAAKGEEDRYELIS
jgi:hypothetical protein